MARTSVTVAENQMATAGVRCRELMRENIFGTSPFSAKANNIRDADRELPVLVPSIEISDPALMPAAPPNPTSVRAESVRGDSVFVIPGNDATYTACASDITIVAQRIVAMSAKNRSHRGSFASPAITGTVSNP